jgi:hypothetical protein
MEFAGGTAEEAVLRVSCAVRGDDNTPATIGQSKDKATLFERKILMTVSHPA